METRGRGRPKKAQTRRGGVRLVAQYLKDARAENPGASTDELAKTVESELREDFGDEVDLLAILLKLLPIIVKLFS